QEAPPEDLICLLQELLDVDRHRRGKVQQDSYFVAIRAEAQARVLGKRFKVRRLAAGIGVSPSTITRWRRSAEYVAAISALVRFHEKEIASWIARDARNRKTASQSVREYFEGHELVSATNREIDWRLSEPSTPWVRNFFQQTLPQETEQPLNL